MGKKSNPVAVNQAKRRSGVSPSSLSTAGGKGPAAAAPENPFDLRVNRKKFNVVGTKPNQKGEVGHRAESRTRGIELREKTLLVEYKQRGKVNEFVDRRFGEKDLSMDLETKMLGRFAKERERLHKSAKGSIFNLNQDESSSGNGNGNGYGYGDSGQADDGYVKKAVSFDDEWAKMTGRALGDGSEESFASNVHSNGKKKSGAGLLTHHGRAIDEIDDFDESALRLDDDDLDDSNVNNFQPEFGGMTRKAGGGYDDADGDARMSAKRRFENDESGDDNEEDDDRHKSHKEIMEDVVAKSKFFKYERQKEKEQVEDLTERLDEEFHNIQSLLAGSSRKHIERQQRDAMLDSKSKKREEDAMDILRSSLARARGEQTSDGTTMPSSTRAGRGAGGESVVDDYDKSVKMLMFDMKARASDRLKTPEEIARDEKDKLEKLERERLRRMKGIESDSEEEGAKGSKHKNKRRKPDESADTLDDNVDFGQDDRKALRYSSSGKLLLGEDDDDDDDDEDEDEEEDDDDGGEEEDDDGEDDNNEDDGEDEGEEDDGEGFDDTEQFGEDNDSEEDDYSDIELDSDELPLSKPKHGKFEQDEDEDEDEEDEESESSHVAESKHVSRQSKKTATLRTAPRADSKQKQPQVLDAVELPFTFAAPESLDDFLALVDGRSDDDQLTIVHRIRVCHDITLGGDNRRKLENLFDILLDYIALQCGKATADAPAPLLLVDRISKHVVELSAVMASHASEAFSERLSEMNAELTEALVSRGPKGASGFPSLARLVVLTLAIRIFPPSDFRHKVLTPLFILLARYLTQSQIQSKRDVLAGLYLTSLFLQSVVTSKRFIPEALSFLKGVIALGVPSFVEKTAGNSDLPPTQQVLPNFGILINKPSKGASDKSAQQPSLRLTLTSSKNAVAASAPRLSLAALSDSSSKAWFASDSEKLQALATALQMLDRFATLYLDLQCYFEVFQPVRVLVEGLDDSLKTYKDKFLSTFLRGSTARRRPLELQRRKAQPIKMYTPKFEEKYEVRQRRDPDKERNEMNRLKHTVKRENKAALREIRKDNAFLAGVQLKEQRERDAERLGKVRKLQNVLGEQQHEANVEKKLKQKNDRKNDRQSRK